MKKIVIKDYFQQEMENLRRTVVAPPSLLIIDGTDGDVGNQIYIRKKVEDFKSLGWPVEVAIPKDRYDFFYILDSSTHDCIIAQMPIAKRFNIDIKCEIPPEKDCDGLTIDSFVMPATVKGIIDYLDACEFPYSGKTAVVLGRSEIVGKPMARALLNRDMTVIQCHSKTPAIVRKDCLGMADLIVSAVGKSKFFSRREISSNAFVVDVGITRDENNHITGDFCELPQFCTSEGGSTPVPGGVGLLTRLGLIKNCVYLVKDKQPEQLAIEGWNKQAEQKMRLSEDTH